MASIEGNRSKDFVWSVAAFVVSFLALIVLTSGTLESVASRWLKFDESYSHGFLLLAVAAFLFSRKWREIQPKPGLFALWLIPLILSLTGYVIGGILHVEALQELALIPVFLSALAVLIGWKQVKPFILPVGLLLFALPFWDYLSWTLQLITVAVNEFGLGLLGIEFTIDGVYVYLTGVGTFEVAHGCSGLRYLLVGQSLAILYGELNLTRVRSRIYLYLAAVSLSLLANWIRVLVIIYLGHETNMQSPLIEKHDNFGWWVFAATLVPLFVFGRKLERSEARQASVVSENISVLENERGSRRFAGPGIVVFLATLGFMVLPSQAGIGQQSANAYDLRLESERYGLLFSTNLSGWRPMIRNADRVFQQTLFDRERLDADSSVTPMSFYVAIHSYDFQRQGAEVIQYHNRLYAPDEWRAKDVFPVETSGGRHLRGLTLSHRASGQQVHIAYGYYVEGHWESDPFKAKLSQLAGLLNVRTDASQITFGLTCDDCDPRTTLTSMIQAELPKMIAAIDADYAD